MLKGGYLYMDNELNEINNKLDTIIDLLKSLLTIQNKTDKLTEYISEDLNKLISKH